MSLNRAWRTVVCVASGPSFTAEQSTLIESARAEGRVRVIAINDNWRRLPAADILFASDTSWWKLHAVSIRASGFAGELWTVQEKAAKLYGLNQIKHAHAPGLNRGQDIINCGGNSGYMAINFAYLFGARRIILVGYDMQKTDGATHWFGNHPKPLANNSPYGTFIKRFDALAADLATERVTVINATAETALRCFPRADLARTLIALKGIE